eukprot:g32134.t1
MLDWRIDLQDGQAVIEPDEVYSTWPQLKMAVQMLGKLPDGPARKNFENQVLSAAKSLQGVKDNFASHCNSKCSEAYIKVLRPSDEEAEKQKYFDAVLERRNYLPLQADMLTEEGEDADLPLINVAQEALESAKKKDKKDKKDSLIRLRGVENEEMQLWEKEEKKEKKEKKDKKDKKDKRAAAAASAFLEEAPPTPVAILQPSPYRIAEGEDGKEEEIAAPEKKDTKKETKSESKKGKGNKPKSAKEPSKGGQKIEQKGQKAPDIEKEGSLDQDMVESKAQEDEQHKAHTIQDSSWCSSWWVLKCFNDMQIP